MTENISAQGINGGFEIHADFVRIKRKGVLSFLTQGLKGDKDIQIIALSSLQFKAANMFTNGYLQLAYMGGAETKRGIFDAAQDENTVMFNKAQQPKFEALKGHLDELMRARRTSAGSTAQAPAGVAEQIASFAKLRDQGILTEDEFIAKKKQLLGL